ncbi:unnamed protein product [Heligmosomoides polygyrus]|uniref:FPG_CAT domain-containing protein n=1 Tax=Heligmosomoides polygyrus TaxID=6339 RepID=A0A183FXL9_HELPZ|nr:unnamed protein product [Heligmosomoides polygyrus]
MALLVKAAHAEFDLDNDVEEIPTAEEVAIFNASGKRMPFKGAVRLMLGKKGNPIIRAAFFEMKECENVLVLGTNVLKNWRYTLNNVKGLEVHSQSEKISS